MRIYQQFLPYSAAIGSTAIALFLSLWLEMFLSRTIGAFFYLAIILSAWYGGFRAGMVAIVLSTLAIDYFFIPPVHQFSIASPGDVLRLSIFLLVALVMNLLTSNFKNSKKQVEQLNQQLVQYNAEQLHQQIEQQQVLMEMIQRIRQSLNLPDILQTTVEEVREFLQCDRALMFKIAPDYSGTILVESVDPAWNSISSNHSYDPCVGEEYIEPFKQGLVTAKSDIYTAQISDCHREMLIGLQVRANLVVPILQEKNLWGLLVVHHCAAPREWQNSEIELLRQLSAQASIAIQQADLFEQVKIESLRIQTIFNTSFDGIVILNREGQVLEANPRFSEMLGYTPEETASLNVFDWDAHFTLEKLHKFLHDSGFISGVFETRHRRKDGSIYDVEISANLLEWQGQIMRFCACRDITERKQTQIALQELNTELEQRVITRTAELTEVNERLQEYERIISNTTDGIATINRHYIYQIANQSYLNWCNKSAKEAIGNSPRNILGAELFDSFIKPLVDRCLTGEKIQYERWFNYPNLVPQFLSVTYTPLYDIGNNIAGVIVSLRDLTQLKQAEQMLELQAVITRNMAEGICLVRGDNGVIVYANPKFEQMFGYDPDELNGQHVSIVNYATEPVIAEEVNQAIRTAVLQNGEFSYEVQNVKKDGTPFWCSATTSIFKHSDYGDVLVAVHQDITQRKEAEATLLQKSQQEHLLWSMTQSIRQSLDLKAILNTAVTEVRRILQSDRAAVYRFNVDWSGDFVVESVGEDWVKLVGADIQKVCEDIYLQETQGGRFKNHETFAIPDINAAGLHPCHVQLLQKFQAQAYLAVPIFSGEILWGLLIIYQNDAPRHWQSWEVELLQQIASQLAIAIQQSNLYEQLQIELQERQQAEATIREAERRWRSLLDNVELIVVGLDRSGNINYVNPFFLDLTGYTSAEVLGKNWFENFIPRSHQQLIQTIFSEVLTNNAYPYYRNAILTKSGEERFIGWNNTMLKDSLENIIGTISIGEDITERQKIERIKDEFIGIVSHELRTPLTAIQMSLGLIKTGVYDQKPEKARRMIEIALLDTNRLVNLVNDILDLERLDSGRAVFEKTLCQAADLIQQAIDGIQAIATQQQISLIVTPTDVEVWAAADAIVQTLTNLLSNAIKFSPPQSAIHLSVTSQIDSVQFQVSDRGRGIPTEKLELIFGRFQQVDSSDSREKGGTGLGLAICRSIIERHGGKIWAESSLGAGSTFFFTLPLPSEKAL